MIAPKIPISNIIMDKRLIICSKAICQIAQFFEPPAISPQGAFKKKEMKIPMEGSLRRFLHGDFAIFI